MLIVPNRFNDFFLLLQQQRQLTIITKARKLCIAVKKATFACSQFRTKPEMHGGGKKLHTPQKLSGKIARPAWLLHALSHSTKANSICPVFHRENQACLHDDAPGLCNRANHWHSEEKLVWREGLKAKRVMRERGREREMRKRERKVLFRIVGKLPRLIDQMENV